MAFVYRSVSGFLDPWTTVDRMLNWYARLGVEDSVILIWRTEEHPHWSDAMSKSDLSPLPVVRLFDPPRDSGYPDASGIFELQMRCQISLARPAWEFAASGPVIEFVAENSS